MANGKRTAQARRKAKRSKKQRRQFNALMRLVAVLVCVLVAAVTIVVVSPKRSRGGRGPVLVNPTATPEVEVAALPITQGPVPEETEPERAETLERPVEEEPAGFKYLPVYRNAETDEKKIAVTVDDCFQVENLQTIALTAQKYGGKLTLFPIGQNLSKPGMKETLYGCAFKLGFELENHTWSHSRIFKLTEIEMAQEIWQQRQALNQLLGVDYEQHFFRLMGGDGDSDQRTHNYLRQLGYLGIANWSVSGSDSSLEACESQLAPGQIYLFHTTDADTAKLRQFIPYAASQGYRLVTLNELLGYPDNAVSTYVDQPMPLPCAYAEDYRDHKVGDYAWNILRMQEKLQELGFLKLDGSATGYYGEQTARAVMIYQQSKGLPATGVADSQTQRLLLGA